MENWVCLVISLLGSSAAPVIVALLPTIGAFHQAEVLACEEQSVGFRRAGRTPVLEICRNPLIPCGLFAIGFVW